MEIHRLHRAGPLLRYKVRNQKVQELGHVEDIMLDIDRGSIAYVVLGFGGVLGLGEKLFAVPWCALRINRADRCFMLDVEKEQLKKAPGFDKDHWPDLSDEQWVRSIHSFYNVPCYWEPPSE